MKRLSVFNKIVLVFNIIVALLLFAASAVPHISDHRFSFLSFLSLAVPFLVGANFSFLLYWVAQKRRQLLLSLFVLSFGYFTLGPFIKLNFFENKIQEDELTVMSYNVRSFNRDEHLKSTTVFEDVRRLIDIEQPDIICFQEPGYRRKNEYLKDYPYQYLDYIYMRGKVLLGIFSKYPIIDLDLLCFPDSPNNAAYADILYKNDTIRIYNVHLQSLGITPGAGNVRNKSKDKVLRMLTEKFKIQQQQAEMVANHMKSNTYKQILCGDFNNSQFSNVYKTLKGDKQDTFVAEGKGYGRTYNYHGIPVRIDFILADEKFVVKSHKNYDAEYSDHFPIMASFELKPD